MPARRLKGRDPRIDRMCGRYASTLPPEMMVELFKLLNSVDIPARWNITPTEPIVAIWEDEEGQRNAHTPRWGFVPAWVKDPKEFPLLINARAEGMADKPAFRNAVKTARCVIPADGYYEWMKNEDGRKQPYYIYPSDGKPIAFAGLYSTWQGPDGNPVETAAIVTVEPNLDISSVYDRMPAMLLTPEAIDMWLDTDRVAPEMAAALAVTPPAGRLQYHAVSKAIGKAESEGPDLIRRMSPEELAAESGLKLRKKVANSNQLSLF
jgi:putative SOS response-associated peptidase YedK